MSPSSLPPIRLIIGRRSHVLRQRLWQLIQEEKARDPISPVTVIGPNRFANLTLRQEFGQNGFINVRFEVLSRLAEMLGGASLSRQGRRPLTPVMENVALRRVLTRSSEPLASVSQHPSTQASIRKSFAELRKEGEGLITALESQGGVRGQVAGLYRTYRQGIVNDWYDRDDLAEEAVKVLRRDETTMVEDLGMIIFYLPRDISPAETGLVRELARLNRCSVILGITGEKEADQSPLELEANLRPIFGKDIELIESDDSPPSTFLETDLHIAPSAHEELRWVIRQVIKETIENKTPFHRMAVLYRLDSPYSTLIPDELDMAGIPVSGPGIKTLAESGAGRVLLGLLRLAGSNFRRSEVMSWLTACPVAPYHGRTPGFNPSRWDVLSRKAGVVGGVNQWRFRMGRLADGLEESADDRERMGEIDGVRAAAMRDEAVSARHAVEFIEQLASDLETLLLGNTWAALCRGAKELLEVYLSHDLPEDSATSNRETEARREIIRILDELASADSIGGLPSPEAFRQIVEEALKTASGTLGATGAGVFVSSFSGATGMSFDVIWMVGMVEGGVPPSIRPDPLLPESGWTAAGGRPRSNTRIAAERSDFLSAMASATRRTLSYPLADGGSQRQAYPSRWFLEQASLLEGRRIYVGDLHGLRTRPWMTIDDSAEQAISGPLEAEFADLHDYNLHRLLRWRREGRWLRHHPLAQQGVLAKAIRLDRSRYVDSWTEFDGNLTEVASVAGFATGLEQAPVSPTRLENWAACPFRYFLGQVLRLSALETPEDAYSISPGDRGRMVHAILESFVSSEVAAGTLPGSGGQWGTASRRSLQEIADERFRNEELNGVTGKPLLWELDKQTILEDLESFLEQDARLREELGTSRILVESRFGFVSDGLDVMDDETQLRFRGYIDRVDVSGDGSSVTVIDYKTGSVVPYEALKDDPVDRGRHLQLGVYSLAARSMFPAAVGLRAAYWFTTNNGGFVLAPPHYFDVRDSASMDRFRHVLSTVSSGIRQGVFPANPGPVVTFGTGGSDFKNCHYCDFDSLCPARRGAMWERKKSDQRLSVYLDLAEGDQEN